MIEIRVDGIEELRRALRRLPSSIKKGAASGINRTMLAVEQHEMVAMERDIDRPTHFSLNAFRIQRARQSRLVSMMQIQPLQAKYLKYPIEGGTLQKILTPVLGNIKLNQYGNITGKKQGLKKIAKGKRFVATISGKTGVWIRQGGRLKLLVFTDYVAKREKRWDFIKTGKKVIEQRLIKDIHDAVVNEIRLSAS